ncbi:hypothetical protein GGQ80_000616 [Sphingomonas jinjuensis]|uniref:Uncharacterized protein n=1 Tax=Sphingomonas jinjuensis TaxID=535907 RepID=A0A840F4E8_9SPHN|nr:hypothetical protein [Sphingomonas jinjuensis]MBB4152740.1 hypothetical protein [Sphingomonas jinjuensis]
MTDDEKIRAFMAAAGMLLEDLSARLVLEPASAELTSAMRAAANDILTIADAVDSIRRMQRYPD